MIRKLASAVLCVMSIGASIPAFAENSEKETPPQEQEAKLKEQTPEAVKKYLAYIEDLDRRYPDSGKVDVDSFLAQEGQLAASLYCGALGFSGPCVIGEKGGQPAFVALDQSRVGRSDWWAWLRDHLFNIGVIPEQLSCPAPFTMTRIYMDDEDRRNANSRWGWLGATVSTNNTHWTFCRLDLLTSLQYRPLNLGGDQYDYAVLNMGLFCPSGARRVFRREDNEDWANANSSSGILFPNFNLWPGNWHTFTCHFDGAASSILGQMPGFPNIGIKYGVFGPGQMPGNFALAYGYVYQDDEDFLNTNFWIGSPDWVMGGGSNTWRRLVKVK